MRVASGPCAPLRNRGLVCTVAGLAMVGGEVAYAGFILPEEGVPLDTVIGVPFLVKDKEFTVSKFVSADFDPSTITIKPVNLGLDGIGFDLLGDFTVGDDDGDDGESGNDGVSAAFALDYSVTILASGLFFNDANLSFDGFATDEDDDDDSNGNPGDDDDDDTFVSVMETILGIGDLSVFVDAMGNEMLTDKIFFDPTETSLSVSKLFEVFAGDDDDDDEIFGDDSAAGATMIRQTFSQIPAPGTLGLLGLGGLWLGGGRRRRRRV